MKHSKLWPALAGLAAASAVFVAATLGAAAAPTAASGTVQLAGWASSPTETALLNQVVRGFQRTFPQIKVDYSPISGDYPTAMLSKFAARTPPDVFYVDSSVAPDWIKQGVLQPLDSYIAKSKFSTKPFFSSLLNGFKGSDGHIYGFPKDWSPLAMEVNQKYLAGKKAPQTWAQLVAFAKSITVPGGKPICIDPDWARALAFVYQNGGSWFNKAGQPTINTPAVKGAANFYVGLVTSGLAADHQQLGVGWCGEALGKEKAAIAFEGNWVVPFMETTFPSVKYGIYPMVRGKQQGNLAFTVSYSMAKDAKNKDAAWQLIRYLTSKPGMRTWTSKGLALPSRADVKPVANRGAFLQAAPYSHPWQFPAGFSSALTVAQNELTAVFEGKETVDGMLQKMQSAAEAAVK